MNQFREWVEERPARHVAVLFLVVMAVMVLITN